MPGAMSSTAWTAIVCDTSTPRVAASNDVRNMSSETLFVLPGSVVDPGQHHGIDRPPIFDRRFDEVRSLPGCAQDVHVTRALSGRLERELDRCRVDPPARRTTAGVDGGSITAQGHDRHRPLVDPVGTDERSDGAVREASE